jgi:DnaJ family protein C protein 3
MRVTAVLLLLAAAVSSVFADAGTGLYPPGLMSAIERANSLLKTRQFADAARAYSEAIGASPQFCSTELDADSEYSDLSPIDYSLYYKRGTANLSLQRYPQALADFQRVLQLNPAAPSMTHLHIARVYMKAGDFAAARASLREYSTLAGTGAGARDAQDLLLAVGEAEAAWTKAERARKAGLWTACVESANAALATASHSPEIRGTRAECGIAGGNIELGVSDLSCVCLRPVAAGY